jgi:hypothetical protein
MTPRTARWLDLRLVLISALAGQYVALQLLTGVQYWDSPRNLHWGIVAQELPRFLIDAENPYDRVTAFLPIRPPWRQPDWRMGAAVRCIRGGVRST